MLTVCLTKTQIIKVFSEDLNLGFGSLKSDTCSTYNMINFDNLTSHHEEVKHANMEMKADRNDAKNNEGSTFLCFNLQQTMILPKLLTDAFYL